MTLEVSLLGEENNKSKIKNWLHYLLASSISGTVSGFVYTTLVYVLMSWAPNIIKLPLLFMIVFLYMLHDFKIINLKVPQNKWQIPATWVNGSTTQNMWVWGLILGAGIFTYLPYVTFYMVYLYLGLLKQPVYGLLFGFIYGLARALPSILITLNKKELNMSQIKLIYMKKQGTFKLFNGGSLFLLSIFLIYKFLQYVI